MAALEAWGGGGGEDGTPQESEFFSKFLEDIPLFWTSGDVSSGFQTDSGYPCLHLAEAYSPLVQHLPALWRTSWQLSQSLPHTCKQVHAGAQNRDLSCRRRKLSRLSCDGHESEPWKSEFCDLLKVTLIFRDILAICCVMMRTSLEHEPRIKLQACLIAQGNVLHKTFEF